MTLRRRVVLVCAAAVALVAVCGSALAYVVVRGALRGEVDDSLRAAAIGMQRRAALPPGAFFTAPADEPLAGPRVAVRLAPPGDRPVDGELRDEEIEGRHVRVLTMTTELGDVLQVARPLTEVDDVLADLRLGLAGLVLIGIAAAAVLSRLAARATVAPVAGLTEAAEHVAATQDLSRRIEAAGDDELGRLASSFNTMLEALDRSRRAQRQLVADASHELRTPLTSLRTNLEVLARADALDDRDRSRLRADLVAQLEDLGVLVGDLVDLARDERVPEEVQDVRLDELALAAVGRARRHAPGVRFTVDAEPTVVRGDPARLDRAIANLLDNAAKFGDGRVEVTVRDGSVSVRDHGPGIADPDLPHVFDRFYRSREARSRPGSGLGLAIVRQVAEAYGGTVRAEAAPGGGALLRLSLNS